MAEVTGDIRSANTGRTRALIVPREHGAWGMLLVPLVTGACVGLRAGGGLSDVALFLTAALALFWLRTPIESLLGTTPMRVANRAERLAVLKAIAGVGLIAVASVAALLWGGRNSGLLIIGAICGAVFALQAAVKHFGRRMRMPSQMIGAIGLTSTAAGAYYVASGRLDGIAFALWFANWIFAGDQIHFVQLSLHGAKASTFAERFAKGRAFFFGQFAMLVVVIGACALHLLPWFAVAAFLPVIGRGAYWFASKPKKLQLHWLGISELLHSITFCALLITSFMLS